jgi:hypothetical protein
VKSFGAEVLKLPAKDVEAMAIMEEINNYYRDFKARELDYEMKRNRR